MPGAESLASASKFMGPLARIWMPVAAALNREHGGGNVVVTYIDGPHHVHYQSADPDGD